MPKRIIYKTPEGGVAIVVPIVESGLTVEEIAQKDVPKNVPYKIIDTVDVPSDRTFRNAWEADITNPDGTGIGHEEWFAAIERQRLIDEEAARHKAEISAQVAALTSEDAPQEVQY